MKLSLSWIKDFVQIPEDLDLKKLAYDLTMSTVEVEDVEDLARRFDHMVVGVIEKIEPHPNADKLRVCKTDIGNGEIKDIVCGGINLREGMRVAVSCPGAVVRWHGEGEPVVIKNSKLRGVESFGMICASSEIGLGDLFPAAEEAEILDLSAFDVPAGTPLADALDKIIAADGAAGAALSELRRALTELREAAGKIREAAALADAALQQWKQGVGEGEKGKAAAKEFWEALGSLAEGFSGLTASADEVWAAWQQADWMPAPSRARRREPLSATCLCRRNLRAWGV